MHDSPLRPFIAGTRLALAAVLLCFTTIAAAASEPPKLLCSPCNLSFGTVKIGSSKSAAVRFTNSGARAITISSKSKNAAWVSPDGLSLPYRLAAHQSINFRLIYAPQDARVINGNFIYHSNATNENLVIRIHASAGTSGGTSGQLVAHPAAQNFGSVQVGSNESLSETLTNQSNRTVRVARVASNNASFSVAGISTPLNLAPGHSVTFQLHFAPKATGAHSGSVMVSSNAKDQTLAVKEVGTGTSGGGASVSPNAFNFGSVTVGSKKALAATIKATGAGITINSASFSSNEYSLSGLALPHRLGAGQSVSFQLVFAPQSSGAAPASLSFATSAQAVQASLQGTGAGGGSGHVVNLSWKASRSKVIGYNIYRGGNSGGPYALISASPEAGTAYSDSTVDASTTYYYVVTAVNNGGEESVYSNQASVTVP